MSPRNRYCEALGIRIPRIETAKDSPDANYYALLIVALLERGEPITLEEAARRLEEAGAAPAGRALASLKRCKPGRPPIYRDGDYYALDPHDDETDLWAFRLGLRPSKDPTLRVIRPDPAVIQAHQKRYEEERAAHAERLAGMRRVIVHAFPAGRPEALVLLDVNRREITTLLGEEIAKAKKMLREYDIIVAVEVRAMLRNLAFDSGERRLGELGPPQKTKQIDQRGRTLRITLDLLVQGSCGISRPFGIAEVVSGYLRRREFTKLRRRLEADAKSLFALYQYGRLHGTVRLRWGFLDESIPAPWVHRDEPTLHHLMQRAHAMEMPIEVVVGSAPGWTDPWSRGQRAHVGKDEGGWQLWLVDERGYEINTADVQMARLAGPEGEEA